MKKIYSVVRKLKRFVIPVRLRRRDPVHYVLFFTCLFFLSSCATMPELRYPPNRWLRDEDRNPIERPKTSATQKHGDDQEGGYFYQIEQLMSLTENLSDMVELMAPGGSKEALNTNNFDEVADSEWFTNRLGRNDMTLQDITGGGPDPKGKWKIIYVDNVTKPASITVEDRSKNIYTIKFGSAGESEYAAGSDIIAQRILHLAGYNVPDAAIVDLNPSILEIGKDSTIRQDIELDQKLTSAELATVLTQFEKGRTGKIRAIAYKWPDGEVVGPFLFHGKRKGDTNDRMPHEYRRELRGYRIFCEFLDRTDPKNTLPFDVFLSYESGKGYIKHYLVNMTLASSGGEEKKGAFKIAPSPSLDDSSWARARKPENVEEETEYDPSGFKVYYFNLAFQVMTKKDAFWAARILSKFTDEDIAAIVAEAKFTDPRASKKMIEDLLTRRDRIVNYWFSKIAPLDDFEVQNGDGPATITFDGLLSGAEYKYQLSTINDNADLTPWFQSGETKFNLSGDVTDRMKQNRIYMLKIMLKRPNSKWWQDGVNVFVKKDQGLKIVGIRR